MTSTHHDGVNLDSTIPRILHYTAPTKTLRRDELRLMKRTHTLLPDWVIRLWDDNDNSRIVQETIPELADNYENIAHGVAKSDIARCLFLYRYGGLYLDTDYRLIRAIDEHLLKADCILPQNRSGLEGFQIGNAIMASKPNYRFWLDFVEDVLSNDLSRLEKRDILKKTGPLAITNFYIAKKQNYLGIVTPERPLFHPKLIFYGFKSEKTRDTYGVHHCWGSWTNKGFLKKLQIYLVREFTSRFGVY